MLDIAEYFPKGVKMGTAIFQYKCRQCGKIYDEGECTEKIASLILLNVIAGSSEGYGSENPPKLLSTHNCYLEGIGVSDLIGYIEKE